MGIEKITEKINEKCYDNPKMKKFLNELLYFQSENTGWWKDGYREIIKKYAKEDYNIYENKYYYIN